jgi:hypothetical protein
MAKTDKLTQWKQMLLNNKFIAALVLAALIIGGVAAFVVNIEKLMSIFSPGPPKLSGSLAIANEFCPFIEHSGAQLRPRGTENLTFFRPPDEFLVILPRIHMEALSPSPPEASEAEFTPSWVQAQEKRLYPDPILAMKSLRLLIYGSTVIDKLCRSYGMRGDKTSEFDEVFLPLPEGRVPKFYHTLQFLARLYPPLDASSKQKQLAIDIVKLNKELFLKIADLKDMPPELQDLYAFYQHLLLKQSDPVFRLTISNLGDNPTIITSIVCQLKRVFPAKDTYESGPLQILGSVTFVLPSQPETIEQKLAQGPIKIAPKDAGSFIIRLKGHSKGAYQLSFAVKRDNTVLYETEDVLVGIFGG